MSLDQSKFCNKARDYIKNNPNSNIYNFLDSSNYYHQLSNYDKKHAIKIANDFFNQNLLEEDKISVDEVLLREELK